MKRKDEAMYAWLKTRGAVLNWQERIGDGRISIVCFTIRGRIMLQMVISVGVMEWYEFDKWLINGDVISFKLASSISIYLLCV